MKKPNRISKAHGTLSLFEQPIANFPQVQKAPVENLLENARLFNCQSNFEKSKDCFENYLDSIALERGQFEIYDLNYYFSEFNEIKDEYIDILVKYKKFDISERNPIIKKFSVDRIDIFNKLCNDSNFNNLSQNELARLYEFHGEAKRIYKIRRQVRLGSIDDYFTNTSSILNSIINVERFFEDNIIFLFNKEIRCEPKYYEALEYNLVKHFVLEKFKIHFDKADSQYREVQYCGNSEESIPQFTPEDYGYSSWAEMDINEVWEGDVELYNSHNE